MCGLCTYLYYLRDPACTRDVLLFSENAERFAAATAKVAARSAPSSMVNGPASSQRQPDVVEQPPPPYTESSHTAKSRDSPGRTSSQSRDSPGRTSSQSRDSPSKTSSQGLLHPPIQPTYGASRTLTSSSYAQPQQYGAHSNNHNQYQQSSPYRCDHLLVYGMPTALKLSLNKIICSQMLYNVHQRNCCSQNPGTCRIPVARQHTARRRRRRPGATQQL